MAIKTTYEISGVKLGAKPEDKEVHDIYNRIVAEETQGVVSDAFRKIVLEAGRKRGWTKTKES